jgi:hypothetical protein
MSVSIIRARVVFNIEKIKSLLFRNIFDIILLVLVLTYTYSSSTSAHLYLFVFMDNLLNLISEQ